MINFMPVLELIRLEENILYGTFGILRINKQVFCVTLELPDLENLQNQSSIPAQQYECFKHDSPTFGETYTILNVPNRKHILFHSGNTIDNTAGCILLAQHFGKLNDSRAILNSGNTFKNFMNIMARYNTFSLTIKEVY